MSSFTYVTRRLRCRYCREVPAFAGMTTTLGEREEIPAFAGIEVLVRIQRKLEPPNP